ncbi:MAG: SUMF1/EgtB/PvdO family nonheme iron enzyme [Bacteroidales bacterium]|nr:SUMF1/EgtB/PvdO family nonheme iron enzyme [Bacteroidales bacterium]
MDISAVKYEVKDLNGIPCALIKLGLVLKDVTFEGSIVKSEYKDGEWWLYMVEGATWLNVKSKKYLPLRYEFPRLSKKVTYIMQVEVPRIVAAGPTGRMEIKSQVQDVDVYVDGEKLSSILPFVYEGPEGEHLLTLKAPGYNEEKTAFTIQLRRKGELFLRLKPEGSVYIDGISYEMVHVPGGKFKMGSMVKKPANSFNYSQPAHQVSLRSFKIGATEVTQALWKAVMGNNPSISQGDQLPVENVSWYDVEEFITKLNGRLGTHLRLPTEAEWEYAARNGGTGDPDLHAGDGRLDRHAVLGEAVSPVGTLAPNRLGLYDMSGNVAEWCSDWLSKYAPESQVNPCGPAKGIRKVVRGGACSDDKSYLTTSYRGSEKPDNSSSKTGFRLASDD